MSKDDNVKKWVIVIVLALIWGSSFILMKRGLEFYTPSQVASFRLIFTSLILLPVFIKNINIYFTKNWIWFFAAGWIGNGIPAFLFTNAQKSITSSLAGMLNSLTPLFTLIIGALFFSVRTKKLNVIGVIIGLIGAIVLIWASSKAGISGSVSGSLLVVFATFLYGTNANILKNKLGSFNPIHVTAFAFCSTGLLIAPYFILTNDFSALINLNSVAWKALMYIFILALFGSAFSVIAFNYLLKITSALFASSVTYLMPIVSIIWGFADNESLNLFQILSIVIILTGIYLVNKREKTV